jgi:predicted kinase
MLERLGRCNALIWSTAEAVLAAGASVVLDTGGMRRADRERIRQLAEAKSLPLQWHFVDAPQEVRRARVADRNAAKGETFVMEVTPEMFERLEAIYEPPAPAELEGAARSASDDATAAAVTTAQPEAAR